SSRNSARRALPPDGCAPIVYNCTSKYTPTPRHSGASRSRPVMRAAVVSAEYAGGDGVCDATAVPNNPTAMRLHQRLPNEMRIARGRQIQTDAGSRHGDKRIPRIRAIRGGATGKPFVSGKGHHDSTLEVSAH